MLKRIYQALATGAAPLPDGGRIAVFDPAEPLDLPGITPDRLDIVSYSAVLHAACAARDLRVVTAPDGTYQAALVCLGRARPFNRVRIAQAVSIVGPEGYVLVDGQKTDGIEPALKDCAERAEITDSYVKSHGRMFWFQPGGDYSDWDRIAADWPQVDGYVTGPGVFSADGVDPGSALLAATLPTRLKGRGVDLGAGWGYLSAGLLQHHPDVSKLYLVEEDHRALSAARANVTDPRAEFVWGDATGWTAPESLDFVITNPPFHAGRAADPALGRAFLSAGARALAKHGTLWMVANRHLPYETHLDSLFHTVTETVARDGYKVIAASDPKPTTTGRRR